MNHRSQPHGSDAIAPRDIEFPEVGALLGHLRNIPVLHKLAVVDVKVEQVLGANHPQDPSEFEIVDFSDCKLLEFGLLL